MKPQDISTFSNKINIFVSHSPYDIKANILGAEIFPIIPKFEKKVGDYNFRLLETPHHFNVKVVYQNNKVNHIFIDYAKVERRII
jgi:hypothetical protein